LILNESDEEENKISRRDFFKLLMVTFGAGMIYKLNFNNYLSINGRTAMEGNAKQDPTQEYLDEDGIAMFGKPMPGGYSYRLDVTKDPTIDRRLDTHHTGPFEIKQEKAIKFIRFLSTNPGTNGQGKYTARFHIFTEDKANEDKQRYNWTNGAPLIGWLTSPKDLSNGEWNLICRPNNILNVEDSIVAKLGGGRHSRQLDKFHDASCWNVHWAYNASIENAISFEYDHPEYEHNHSVKLFNQYKPLGDRWFGCKIVSVVTSDKSARHIITYFNEDPIDENTGKPKNIGWKRYFEFTHVGQGDKYKIPHTWGGAKNTWRTDWLTSVDIACMNHREIMATPEVP
jgi:hypothetical protein